MCIYLYCCHNRVSFSRSDSLFVKGSSSVWLAIVADVLDTKGLDFNLEVDAVIFFSHL